MCLSGLSCQVGDWSFATLADFLAKGGCSAVVEDGSLDDIFWYLDDMGTDNVNVNALLGLEKDSSVALVEGRGDAIANASMVCSLRDSELEEQGKDVDRNEMQETQQSPGQNKYDLSPPCHIDGESGESPVSVDIVSGAHWVVLRRAYEHLSENASSTVNLWDLLCCQSERVLVRAIESLLFVQHIQ